MTTPKVMIDADVYRKPVLRPSFEFAINNLVDRYSLVPVGQITTSSIKREMDIINNIYSKQIEVDVLEDGTIIFKGEGINMSLTRKVLVEKI